MPIRNPLGRKTIQWDARRLRTALGVAGSGGGGSHPLLGAVHSDTETVTPPDEGSLVLANSDFLWDVLLHNDTRGCALVSSATTWTMDQAPFWTGIHTFEVGKAGESLAWHCAMNEGHGLGGITVVAPSASLRSTITV
jgi:hypothetical protein